MRTRPFEESDAPAVASLWQYWFRDKTRTPDPRLIELVRAIHVERPGGDPDVTSLVATDDAGRLQGFLGVTATPVIVDGERRTLAGVFPSVVDPDAPTMVASFLLRKLLAGPQALTFSDGGHVKFERIWEMLGGQIAPTASLRWVKVLRPARLGAETTLGARSWGPAGAPVWRPVANGVDWIARRARPGWFRAAADGFEAEPLTPDGLIEAIAGIHARTRLRPDYDAAYLDWLFERMAAIPDQGTFEAWRVLAPSGGPAGWWVAYLAPGRTSRVFALDGADKHLGAVIDHLFARADEAGAGALIGRLDPRLRGPMAERGTFTHNGGSLQMIHAADASLLDAALLGRLAFSRLEGENWYWWGIVPR